MSKNPTPIDPEQYAISYECNKALITRKEAVNWLPQEVDELKIKAQVLMQDIRTLELIVRAYKNATCSGEWEDHITKGLAPLIDQMYYIIKDRCEDFPETFKTLKESIDDVLKSEE